MAKAFITPADIKVAKYAKAKEEGILEIDITDQQACSYLKDKREQFGDDYIRFLHEIHKENIDYQLTPHERLHK